MHETEIDASSAEFEAVEFKSGWFVVRERDSKGENGQWIATRTPVEVDH